MISKIKKPVSILLALMMVVGLFTIVPISAGAAEITVGTAEELNDAIANAQDGDTIKLSADITLPAQTIDGESTQYGAYITKSLTIDGDGHTVTSPAVRVFGVKGTDENKVDVTFKNITITDKAKGAICVCTRGGLNSLTLDNATLSTQDATGSYIQPLTIGGTQASKATVTVKNNSVIQTADEGTKHYAIILWNPVDLTIKNSTVKGWACVYVKPDATGTTATIDNSALVSKNIYTKGSNSFAVITSEAEVFDCEITNTTIDVNCTGTQYQRIAAASSTDNSVKLGEGNTVTLTGDPAVLGATDVIDVLEVSGGTFNKPVAEEFCADGFIPATLDAETGTYSVKTGTYVAQVGDDKYETLEAAVAAAQVGDTVKLLADVTLTEPFVIAADKDFTLDLNGKDITGDVNDKMIQNHGTVVVDDTSAAPGHIYNTNIDKQGNAAFVNYGTATVNNGYFGDKNSDMTDANDVNRGAGFQNYGTATIDGGYFTACDNFTNTAGTGSGYAYAIINYGDITVNDATVYGKNNGNLANNEGTMVVNGGSFTLNKPAKKNVFYSIYNGSANAQTTVYGGTFANNGTKALLYTGEGTTEIKGGNFTNYAKLEQSTGAPAISGGTFKATVPEEYCADGFIPKDNGDGTYGVKAGTYVAEANGVKYETVNEAVAAAGENGEVKLIADITGNVGIGGTTAPYTTTLDLNGHTITNNGGSGITLYSQYGNPATFTIKDSVGTGGITITKRYPGDGCISDSSGRHVVIEGGTYTSDDKALYISSDEGWEINGGTFNGKIHVLTDVDITGGTFNGEVVQSSKPDYTTPYPWTEIPAEIDISGGTFSNPVPEEFCADGYIPKDNGDGTYGVKTGAYVAQIGDDKYETLEAAFAAAQDGDTIKVLADCAGNGIKVPVGKYTTGLTVDFDGHTYTVDGETVGSPGTETNGFQLLKDNNITFKNGTITSTKAKILVQNYSNLTLDNMELTLNKDGYNNAYTLSNNNGDVVIKDTTINANPTPGSFAFDVCRYSSYPSVNVTVTGDSEINGNVEVYATKSNPRNGFSLTLESGTLNGDIVLDQTAKNALATAPDKTEVTKKNTFNQTAPEGYQWKDNGDGTSSLAKIENLFIAHSITLGGDIGVNFYINSAAADFANAQTATVKLTWDNGKYNEEVDLKAQTPDTNGWYKATVDVVAAQMAHKIHAVVYLDGVALTQTDDYSVQDYAEKVYNNPEMIDPANSTQLKDLAKALLNYGANAQTVFDATLKEHPALANTNVGGNGYENVTAEMIGNAIQGDSSDLNAVAAQLGAKYYTNSVVYLSKNTLRIYFTPTEYGQAMPNAGDYAGNQANYYYYVQKADIAAADLDEQQTFTVGGTTFSYSALDYAKMIVESNMPDSQKNLAKSLYLYNQAANAYFG